MQLRKQLDWLCLFRKQQRWTSLAKQLVLWKPLQGVLQITCMHDICLWILTCPLCSHIIFPVVQCSCLTCKFVWSHCSNCRSMHSTLQDFIASGWVIPELCLVPWLTVCILCTSQWCHILTGNEIIPHQSDILDKTHSQTLVTWQILMNCMEQRCQWF